MGKNSLNRLGQYQAGLALAAVLGIGLGIGVAMSAPLIAWVCMGIGFVALLALLISIPVGMAASAIVESRHR